jgi:hypothetical protein
MDEPILPAELWSAHFAHAFTAGFAVTPVVLAMIIL